MKCNKLLQKTNWLIWEKLPTLFTNKTISSSSYHGSLFSQTNKYMFVSFNCEFTHDNSDFISESLPFRHRFNLDIVFVYLNCENRVTHKLTFPYVTMEFLGNKNLENNSHHKVTVLYCYWNHKIHSHDIVI